MIDDHDLRDLMDEERGRGRKQPRATLNQRRVRMFLRAWPKLVEEGVEGKFLEGLSEIGFEEGSVEWQRALELWRAHWKP